MGRTSMTEPRRRRTADQAVAEILTAAEALLTEGGVAAVQVRAVAARVGITDAAVNYHVGTREQLLLALLRHGGKQIRAGIRSCAADLAAGDCDLDVVVDALGDLYEGGYAELLYALRKAGWRDRGTGLMADLVDVLHSRRPEPRPDIDDTRLAVAALNQSLLADALLGGSSRRATGLASASGGREQRQWWVGALRCSLGIEN
jgi:AcrR family transcriptional regulator